MEKISKKQQIYFIILGAILLAGILIGGIAFPLFKKLEKTGEEIKNQKALLALIGEQKGYYYRLSSDYEALKKEFEIIPSPFLSSEPTEAVHFVEFLEGVANANNLKFEFKAFSPGSGISAGRQEELKAAIAKFLVLKTSTELEEEKSAPADKNKEKKEEIPFLSYQVSLEGEFVDIIKFLINLENLQYYTQIDSMTMNAVEIMTSVVPKEGEESAETTSSRVEKIRTEISGRVYLDPTLNK